MPLPDKRSEGRSNVFLSASLRAGARTIPVRIRNVASRGALVESESLPAIGAQVTLVRGNLSATGQLAWDGAGQAGINFDEPVNVQAWIERIGHRGQQRVDQALQAIRTNGDVCDEKSADELGSLVQISQALDAVCVRIASTPELPLDLSGPLITLDTIAQALRRKATGRPY